MVALACAGMVLTAVAEPSAKPLVEPDPQPKRHTGAREAARRLRQIAARKAPAA